MNERSSKPTLRRQFFVAEKAQGIFLYRVVLYSILASWATSILFLAGDLIGDDLHHSFHWCAPIILAPVITIPLILRDAAIVSNRLVGPFARVHGAIRRLANRDPVSPLEVRDETWSELIQDFNVMIMRVQARTSESASQGEKS